MGSRPHSGGLQGAPGCRSHHKQLKAERTRRVSNIECKKPIQGRNRPTDTEDPAILRLRGDDVAAGCDRLETARDKPISQ